MSENEPSLPPVCNDTTFFNRRGVLATDFIAALRQRHRLAAVEREKRPFRVDAEKCIKCGKCAAVCPVGDISFKKGCTPQWKHNGKCLSCFACYHHCPTRAIEYGGRTKGKGQYYYEKNEKTIISKA